MTYIYIYIHVVIAQLIPVSFSFLLLEGNISPCTPIATFWLRQPGEGGLWLSGLSIGLWPVRLVSFAVASHSKLFCQCCNLSLGLTLLERLHPLLYCAVRDKAVSVTCWRGFPGGATGVDPVHTGSGALPKLQGILIE